MSTVCSAIAYPLPLLWESGVLYVQGKPLMVMGSHDDFELLIRLIHEEASFEAACARLPELASCFSTFSGEAHFLLDVLLVIADYPSVAAALLTQERRLQARGRTKIPLVEDSPPRFVAKTKEEAEQMLRNILSSKRRKL